MPGMTYLYAGSPKIDTLDNDQQQAIHLGAYADITQRLNGR